MQNTNKLNSFITLLVLVTFSFTSCENKTDPIPIQQEIDNTVELKEAFGTAIQVNILAPEKIRLEIFGNREMYLDQNGEGYILGYKTEIKFPLSLDLTKFTDYYFKIEVLQQNGSYSTLSESVLELVDIIKSPDLNKDGKVQNNEKYLLMTGTLKLKSSILENKKNLFEYSDPSKRELIDSSNMPTGRWVPMINMMKTIKERGLLKCTIIGMKSSTKEVISLIDIDKFEN